MSSGIWAFVKSPNLVATGMDLVCLSMYLYLIILLDIELVFGLKFGLMTSVKWPNLVLARMVLDASQQYRIQRFDFSHKWKKNLQVPRKNVDTY